jgi:UDP-N-acetylmuramoylalanine--D-glutamate ligase
MMKNPIIRPDMAVAVMGLGVSGRSAVRYLHSCGARVYVSDARSLAQLSPAERELISDCCAGYEGEEHTSPFLAQAEMIFISPGIPGNLPVLERARRDGIRIVGELALAAPVLHKPTIAITGTNGKTTVTTLIGELLERSGKSVFVGGNIGRPLFDYLLGGQKEEVAVVEVSSFQLELAGDFRPDTAVLLNITPDHLDRHGSMIDYIRAKSRIFSYQRGGDFAVINADDLISREQANHLEAQEILLYGHSRECRANICESTILVKMNGKVEEYSLANTSLDNYIGRSNSAAAILAVRAMGADQSSIQQGLASFQPLPHRMQMVEEIDGIRFCNDSKATNTGAVLSALEQTTGMVVLIAGGRDKGENYQLLKSAVQAKVRGVVLIGEAADQIEIQLGGVTAISRAGSMEEAVKIAAKTAIAGDTVLLSPACASFDMFTSYGHRGDAFMELVRRLKAEHDQQISRKMPQ